VASSSISVIIPNYNHAQYIEGQLHALVSQSISPLEVVVIDDGSTDSSVEVISRFASKNPTVRLVRNEQNLGVVATLNRGLREARGEYFYGGAADDLVAPQLIERVQRAIDRHPEAGIYFGHYRLVDAGGHHIGLFKPTGWTEESYAPPERFLSEYLEVEHCTQSLSTTTVYRKQCVDEIGGYRPELGHWCDTFMLRAIGLKYGAVHIPAVLGTTRFLASGFSRSSARNAHLMLDIVARAAWLMRSPQFRDRFPEAHVARWEDAYRRHVIWQYQCALREDILSRGDTGLWGVLARNRTCQRTLQLSRQVRARLASSYHRRRLQAYTPDLTCYQAASR
jgi:glycosyltransferase involved in cell wall biosynthesis